MRHLDVATTVGYVQLEVKSNTSYTSILAEIPRLFRDQTQSPEQSLVRESDEERMFQKHDPHCGKSLAGSCPRWATVDAEIKPTTPPTPTTTSPSTPPCWWELAHGVSKVPSFKAWSRSEYSFSCCVCTGLLPT